MSFPAVVFDRMIRDLGELVQLRDQALRRPELARSAPVGAAVQALRHAVSAVGRVAEVGDRQPEVQDAERALADARRLFVAVPTLCSEPSSRADGQTRPWPPSSVGR